MLKQLKNKSGFTLIESMVVLLIMVTVITLGSDYIITGFKGTTFESEQHEAIQNARKALENISKDVREASQSERGDYPLSFISAQNFIWYGDIDNDNEAEKIRYFLNSDNTLRRVVTQPGALGNYDGSVTTTTIAYYVNNQAEPIFSYFNSLNAATNIINDVRLVNVRLKLNVTPAVAPNDYYIESDIQLRNLKDNL